MGYSEAFKLEVVAEYEGGSASITGLQQKYGIGGNTTITKWVKKCGKTGLGSVDIRPGDSARVGERLENASLRNELEDARLRIVALEALVEASSKHTGIDLKKKFGGKR